MSDAKIATLAILKADTAVTALVQSSWITVSWPTSYNAAPCITVNLLNNSFNDYYDNLPKSEDAEVEVHVFCLAGTNGYAIANAVSNAMKNAGWHRYFMYEFSDPNLKIPHWVLRFSNKVFQ